MTQDAWDPDQYARFERERSQPFYDLMALVELPAGADGGAPRVVDLGCGTGELTRVLHRTLGAAETVGVDRSAAMLERSATVAGEGLRFEPGDISGFDPAGRYDVVFSNAALQWVPDHEAVLGRIVAGLPPGGQLAVQVPANDHHPSHVLAATIAGESPFREALGGYVRRSHILTPSGYARLLDGLGCARQHVRLQVYPHHLSGPGSVAEWVRGSLLTDYRGRLPADLYDAFLDRYRRRLPPLLTGADPGDATDGEPDVAPYFYPFERILLWARR